MRARGIASDVCTSLEVRGEERHCVITDVESDARLKDGVDERNPKRGAVAARRQKRRRVVKGESRRHRARESALFLEGAVGG